MIKILEIGMTDNLGGIETCLINIYRKIDKEVYQLDFIKMGTNDICFQKELEENGSLVIEMPDYLKHPIQYSKRLKDIVKRNQYDIIHINKNSLAIPTQLIAAHSSGRKVILHSHSTCSNQGKIGSILHKINQKLFLKYADYYFSCSESASKWMFNESIINSNKHFYINNSIDVEKFKYNETVRNNMREELNISSDAIVIGHVGRFMPVKNHGFIVDIFNEIHKMYQNAMLMLIGIGPLEEQIQQKVKELKLDRNVLFLGKRNDVYKLYQAMDTFLMPSIHEGFPMVAVEAQAAGLPCYFSTNVNEKVQIIDTTYLISLQEDAKYWAKNICENQVTDRNKLYPKIVDSNYNSSKEVKKLENIFRNIKDTGENK